MKHSFSFEVSEQVVGYAVNRFLWRKSGWRDVIALFVGCGGIILLDVLDGPTWITVIVSTVFIVLLVVLGGVVLAHRHQTLSRVRAMSDKHVKIDFDDAGMRCESCLATSFVKWSAVERIWRFDKAWLVIFQGESRMTLPVEAMADDIRSFVISRVKEHGGTVA